MAHLRDEDDPSPAVRTVRSLIGLSGQPVQIQIEDPHLFGVWVALMKRGVWKGYRSYNSHIAPGGLAGTRFTRLYGRDALTYFQELIGAAADGMELSHFSQLRAGTWFAEPIPLDLTLTPGANQLIGTHDPIKIELAPEELMWRLEAAMAHRERGLASLQFDDEAQIERARRRLRLKMHDLLECLRNPWRGASFTVWHIQPTVRLRRPNGKLACWRRAEAFLMVRALKIHGAYRSDIVPLALRFLELPPDEWERGDRRIHASIEIRCCRGTRAWDTIIIQPTAPLQMHSHYRIDYRCEHRDFQDPFRTSTRIPHPYPYLDLNDFEMASTFQRDDGLVAAGRSWHVYTSDVTTSPSAGQRIRVHHEAGW